MLLHWFMIHGEINTTYWIITGTPLIHQLLLAECKWAKLFWGDGWIMKICHILEWVIAFPLVRKLHYCLAIVHIVWAAEKTVMT